LALYHRQIPPSINYDRPNPHINFTESPFYVNDRLVDWQATDTPRRAGVSSFGGGGTNAHVILEEPPASLPSSASRPAQLLLLSGKTELALDRQTTNLRDYLQQHPDLNLADVAHTLQQGRQHYHYRRSIVCQNLNDAIENLTTLPPQFTATRHTDSQTANVVFMFSGQGTQYLQMGANLYKHEPIFQGAIDRCTEILQPLLGRDLRQLLYPSGVDVVTSTELLSQTRYTNPPYLRSNTHSLNYGRVGAFNPQRRSGIVSANLSLLVWQGYFHSQMHSR
jgi:acyl transferase domain-containing protein